MDSTVRILMGMLAAVLLVACTEPHEQPVNSQTIVIGVLPDQGREALERRHTPLVDYLKTTTGLDLQLTYHDSYDAFSKDFAEHNIDLAWFGGLTFVRAQYASQAEPLVMRDIDNRFVSHYIVRANTSGKSISDFEGARIAFGPKLSTSGHLMPRHFLQQRGVDVRKFFASVRHARAHDQTAEWVRKGAVDIGAVNSVILQTMIEDGRLPADELRVLEITPAYANYVWGVQNYLDDEIKLVLRNAFLGLDPVNAQQKTILELQGAMGYIPAISDDFAATRAAAAELDLLSTMP